MQPTTPSGRSNPQSEPYSSSQQSGEFRQPGQRENVERLSEDIRHRAGRMASDVSSTAREYYDDASQWLQQNYGKTLAVVGILTAVGLIGFWMSRNNGQRNIHRM